MSGCEQPGITVVPTVAVMGQGILKLFKAATNAVREEQFPNPQQPDAHIIESLQPLRKALHDPAPQSLDAHGC